MRRKLVSLTILAAAAALTVPVIAQNLPTEAPGKKDRARAQSGNYTVDASHAQVAWEVNHFGFNAYHGVISGITGTLKLDTANPSASVVDVQIPIARFTGGNADLDKHMLSKDFFEVEKFPTATFKSTSVVVEGDGDAKITGNLTIKGVTKPVTLDAEFVGAGLNPFIKKETVGFEAEATIKRSDFGMSYGIPMVTDEVKLEISAAFEKQ